MNIRVVVLLTVRVGCAVSTCCCAARARIWNIVSEEGLSAGGAVVQDCLELLNNLLRGNTANQRLFRYAGAN